MRRKLTAPPPPPPLSADDLRGELVVTLLNPLQEQLAEIKELMEQMMAEPMVPKRNDSALEDDSGRAKMIGKFEAEGSLNMIPLPKIMSGIKGSATQAVSTAGHFVKDVTNSSFGMLFKRNVPSKVIEEEFQLPQPALRRQESPEGGYVLLRGDTGGYDLVGHSSVDDVTRQAITTSATRKSLNPATQARHSVVSSEWSIEESETGVDDFIVANASHKSAFSSKKSKTEGRIDNKLSIFAHGSFGTGVDHEDSAALVIPTMSTKDRGIERFRIITSSWRFDYLIGFAILLSAILIGLQIDYKARRWTHETPLLYLILDIPLCILFIVECCMRMAAHGLRHYFRKFNRKFDLLCTCSLTIESVLVWTLPSKTLFALGWLYSLFVLARVARLSRIVHFFKILDFSPELRMLWSSLLQSIQSLFWTCILLLGIVYISSVYLTCFVAMAKLQNLERRGHEDSELEIYFGTLDKTMMSLYQAMSEGLHWAELEEPLRKHCSPWASVFFALYIAFMLFAIMNVITAHLCDYAVKLGKREIGDRLIYDLRNLFTKVSVTHGEFTLEEFKAQLDTPEMRGILESFELTEQDALNLFEVLDPNDSGKLRLHAFVDGLQRLNGPAKATDVCNLLKQQQDFAEHIDHNLRKHLENVNEILHSSRWTSQRESRAVSSKHTEQICAVDDS